MNTRAGRIDKRGITSDDLELEKEGKDEDDLSQNWVMQVVNGKPTWVKAKKIEELINEAGTITTNDSTTSNLDKEGKYEDDSLKNWVRVMVNGKPSWVHSQKIKEESYIISNLDKDGRDENNSSKNWGKQMVKPPSVKADKHDDDKEYSSEGWAKKLVNGKLTLVKGGETHIDQTKKSMVATSKNNIISTHDVHDLAKCDQAFVAIFGLPIKGYPIQIYRTGGGTYFGQIGSSGLTDLGDEWDDDVKYEKSWVRGVELLNWVPLGEQKIVEEVDKRGKQLKIEELSNSEDHNIYENKESKYDYSRGPSVKLVEWVEEKVKEIQFEISDQKVSQINSKLLLEPAPMDTTSTSKNPNGTENTGQVGGNTHNFGFTADRGGTINMENVTNNMNYNFGNIDTYFVDIVALKLAKYLEMPITASIASILRARDSSVN